MKTKLTCCIAAILIMGCEKKPNEQSHAKDISRIRELEMDVSRQRVAAHGLREKIELLEAENLRLAGQITIKDAEIQYHQAALNNEIKSQEALENLRLVEGRFVPHHSQPQPVLSSPSPLVAAPAAPPQHWIPPMRYLMDKGIRKRAE